MRKIKMPTEYPVQDGHRLHFVHSPIQLDNGKWIAVEVLKDGGYISPYHDGELNPSKRQFDLLRTCQAACDIHNNWLGFSRKQAERIIKLSMNASKRKQRYIELISEHFSKVFGIPFSGAFTLSDYINELSLQGVKPKEAAKRLGAESGLLKLREQYQ